MAPPRSRRLQAGSISWQRPWAEGPLLQSRLAALLQECAGGKVVTASSILAAVRADVGEETGVTGARRLVAIDAAELVVAMRMQRSVPRCRTRSLDVAASRSASAGAALRAAPSCTA